MLRRFGFGSKKCPVFKGLQAEKTSPSSEQTFILEPILTPSGIVDGTDDTPDPLLLDVDMGTPEEAELPEGVDLDAEGEAEPAADTYIDAGWKSDIPDEELEEIPFIDSLDDATGDELADADGSGDDLTDTGTSFDAGGDVVAGADTNIPD
jgi:hypothetical protein